VPGGTLQKPLEAKQATAEKTVLLEGDLDVFGTGWLKPATPREEGGGDLLIQEDEAHEQACHVAYTASRYLPFRRLAFKTLRPSRVRIRRRNPWRRLATILDGVVIFFFIEGKL